MIQSLIPTSSSTANVTAAEYDPTEANMSIGGLAMRRAKRDGRNPSTGARTSKKFGISMLFSTSILPLNDSENQPIY